MLFRSRLLPLNISNPFQCAHFVIPLTSLLLIYLPGSGEKHTFNLSDKHSSSIFTDLMDKYGGSPWSRWKQQRQEAGLPLTEPPVPVPTKLEIKAEALGPKIKKIPELAKKLAAKNKASKKSGKKDVEKTETDYSLLFSTKKTGAAAVLP